MSSQQLVSIVVTVGIYVGLIGFVLYRQMTRTQLNPRRLVLLPAILGVLAIQQLSRQHLSVDGGVVAYLAVNIASSIALGAWRGTTFRLWIDAGRVMIQGTAATLVSWGVLIALRVVLALASHASKYAQGLIIGELLLALALTFAMQNVVVWLRAAPLNAGPRPLR